MVQRLLLFSVTELLVAVCYTLTLTDKSDYPCQRTVVVGPQASCSAGCSTPIQFICDTLGKSRPTVSVVPYSRTWAHKCTMV